MSDNIHPGLLAPQVVDCSSLVLDPANARKHPDRNLESIKGSLSQFGQRKPLIVRRGLELRLPMERTYSCHTNEPIHCGTCAGCVERKMAFRQAGVVDWTAYLNQGMQNAPAASASAAS